MWSEFIGLVRAVKLCQPEAKAFQEKIVKYTVTSEARTLLEKMKPEEKTPGDSREYRAFHALCKACIYEGEQKPALESSLVEALNSERELRSCGNRFNEGVVYQVIGTIYHKLGRISMAMAEFNRAIEVFKLCGETYYSEDNFTDKKECDQHISECKSAIKRIEQDIAPSSAGAQTKNNEAKKQSWPTARIVYGVYDFAHASREGVYVMNDDLINQIGIDELIFDGKIHKIHSAQKGNYEITLTPGKDYRWLRVAGESMNQAGPTSILPDDYVLADINRNANVGDIVIASLQNPPTPAERAGVIKRFGGNELRSESNEKIESIPIAEAKIRGVVIAIAKPVEE